MECPICLDDIIQGTKNTVTTECGHTFHCSCLMCNVSHNGFSCPYCRTIMAEETSTEDDDSIYSDEYEMFEDDALTSFRMFHQRNENDDVEDEPLSDEDDDEILPGPNLETITTQLLNRGVTFQDLVKYALWVDQDDFLIENESESEQYYRTYNATKGKVRAVIHNYRRSA